MFVLLLSRKANLFHEIVWTKNFMLRNAQDFFLKTYNNNIYDLYRAYTGGSMRHYNNKMKQYIELKVK